MAGTLTNKMAPALRKVLVDAMVHGGEKNFLKYLSDSCMVVVTNSDK